MYKKKQFLAMCLAGLCSTTMVANVYNVTAMAATAASQAAETSAAADSTSDAGAATITVNLDQDSTWVVTGDTTVFALNAEDGAQIVDEDGKTVTIIADGTTVVKGDSDRTVTVTGSYSQNVTTSEANTISATTIDRDGLFLL